ncbi:MAG: nuclear transport factor 2 family protein [Saprospiraceae bacterium]|nr:nuclear transport factor 2 family protein [Saprospiraceae bacterium]MBK9678584.1 nuclear transport factor 2 family protein [Saprospiraceae bacterium]MBK9931110.1 nuclear transport factor 2 family protein [Saprospiraceae bacterium]MBL0111507.1 nuclear transport factor 2 family protein [Saprospiraceae bacterium]
MKKILALLICLNLGWKIQGQETKDHEGVTKALLNYVEGFYEGDTLKLIQCLKPSLHKIGYWKNKKTGEYDYEGQMTYVQAIEFARNVMIKKSFAKQDAPKKVIVLDIQEKTAAGKVYAWWGIDYVLLSKDNDKWMIEQVLWEGPPAKENK